MNKNIIVVVVLVILLVASVGWGWYSYQGNSKLQDKVKALESEKTTLQGKIEKGLAYAESLDILLDPARKQVGLPVKQNFSETELLSKLEERIKATGDSQLQSDLDTMKKGGNAATTASISFMARATSAIVDTLKQ